MVTKITVTINFTKFVNGKKSREWTETRTLCTTPQGKRYIWWLKHKLPVSLVDEKFWCDVHVRKVTPKLPEPPVDRKGIGGNPNKIRKKPKPEQEAHA